MNINWNKIKPNEMKRGKNAKSDGAIQYGPSKNGNPSNAIAFYNGAREKMGIERGDKVSIGFTDGAVYITKKPTQYMFKVNSARYLYDKNLVREIIKTMKGSYPRGGFKTKFLIDFVEVDGNPGIYKIVERKEVDEFGFYQANGVMNGVYEAN